MPISAKLNCSPTLGFRYRWQPTIVNLSNFKRQYLRYHNWCTSKDVAIACSCSTICYYWVYIILGGGRSCRGRWALENALFRCHRSFFGLFRCSNSSRCSAVRVSSTAKHHAPLPSTHSIYFLFSVVGGGNLIRLVSHSWNKRMQQQ